MPTIYVMRHGEAELQAPSDAERSLTDYGKAYSGQIGQQLNDILIKQQIDPPWVIHSPYHRAMQTAGEIERVLGAVNKICLPEAAPDSLPNECFKKLEAYAEQSFILVSHMPLVAALSSLIERGNTYEAQPFRTSEIRAYNMEHWGLGCGEFVFNLV